MSVYLNKLYAARQTGMVIVNRKKKISLDETTEITF